MARTADEASAAASGGGEEVDVNPESVGKILKDLDLTNEETDKFTKAFKDPKFVEMFAEYAKEIADPAHRAETDAYLRQLERDGEVGAVYGEDVQLVMPTAGFVCRCKEEGTPEDAGEQAGRVYVNVCSSDKVAVYSQRKAEGGTSFDVPYSLGVLREESTKDGTPAKALDFVVHPDTMALAQRNARFKTLVCDVARDAVVRGREIKLERDYYCPKGMVYKGPAEGPSVQTVRNKGKAPAAAPAATGQVKPTGVPSEVASLRAQSLPTAQTQEGPTSSSGGGKSPFSFDLAAANAPPPPRLQYADNGEVVPDHTLVHSGTLRYEEHFAVQAGVGTSAKAGARPSLPERLILTVRLPELKSAAAADLDVSPQRLVLTSEATAKFPGYRLDLTLPYEVDDSAGSAKWVKDKRELRVTLPVVPPPAPAPRPFVEPAPEEPEEEGEEEEVEREDGGEVASVAVDGGGADTEQFEDPSSEGAGPGTQSDLSPAQGDPQAGDYEGSLATDGGVVAQTAVDEALVPSPYPASAPEPALKPSFGGASFLFDLE